MNNKSIKFEEKISSHCRYWKRFFEEQIKFIKIFSNYFKIIIKLFKMEFPIVIKVKKIGKIQIKSYNAAYFISNSINNKNIEFNIDEDLVIIKNNKNQKIKFYGGINNGDLIHSFLDSDYSNLEFKEKYVIDIGMNIADSSIYFILNGAKKVIGVEPFTKNFDIASKNIKENKLENKIEIIQAMCSTRSGKIKINSDEGVEGKIEKSKIGTEIEVISINDIIKKYNVPNNSILKMDCEGCEDEVISSIETNTIRHFSHIQIEYHNGYKKIKNKLEKCGFEVKTTSPICSNVISNILYNFTNKKVKRKSIGYVGFIFAKKMELLN